jgi:hypothetical protein
MRVKQDAIPGIEQRLWFTPTRTGEWEIGTIRTFRFNLMKRVSQRVQPRVALTQMRFVDQLRFFQRFQIFPAETLR